MLIDVGEEEVQNWADLVGNERRQMRRCVSNRRWRGQSWRSLRSIPLIIVALQSLHKSHCWAVTSWKGWFCLLSLRAQQKPPVRHMLTGMPSLPTFTTDYYDWLWWPSPTSNCPSQYTLNPAARPIVEGSPNYYHTNWRFRWHTWSLFACSFALGQFLY